MFLPGGVRRPEWIAAALGAVAWVAFRLGTGIVLEDALITFRFAENLASGRGFAFNPGEPVLGTTTPLFTLILAGLARIFGIAAIPTLAVVVLVLSAGVAVVCTAQGLRAAGMDDATAATAAFAVALHPDILWSTAGGLETMLVVALMAASFEALARGRAATAGAFAGAVVLARPDGGVWAGLVLAATFAGGARAGLRAGIACAAVVAPWIAWATFAFGSPLPQSMLAKGVTVGADPFAWMRPSAIRQSLGWVGGWGAWLPFPRGEALLAAVAFVLGLTAVGLGWARFLARPRVPALLVVVVFPAALAIAYHVGQAPKVFPWYHVPATWALLIAFAAGAVATARGARSTVARAGTFAAAAVLVLAVGVDAVRTFAYERAIQENEDVTRRWIGEWIDTHAAPGTSVAMEAIGYQGTFARRRVVDLAGLITPEVTRLRRESGTNAEVYRRILERTRPDYLVLRSFEVDENRHRDGGPFFAGAAAESAFHAAYEEVARRTAPHPRLWEGSDAALTIYERRPSRGKEAR